MWSTLLDRAPLIFGQLCAVVLLVVLTPAAALGIEARPSVGSKRLAPKPALAPAPGQGVRPVRLRPAAAPVPVDTAHGRKAVPSPEVSSMAAAPVTEGAAVVPNLPSPALAQVAAVAPAAPAPAVVTPAPRTEGSLPAPPAATALERALPAVPQKADNPYLAGWYRPVPADALPAMAVGQLNLNARLVSDTVTSLPGRISDALPKIKTVQPTGGRELVVANLKCPAELITGQYYAPANALREGISGLLNRLNDAQLLKFDIQLVCS